MVFVIFVRTILLAKIVLVIYTYYSSALPSSIKKCWQVPAFKLRVGDLVMVENQTESLTHVDFDPATFEVSWLLRRKTEWLVPLLEVISKECNSTTFQPLHRKGL